MEIGDWRLEIVVKEEQRKKHIIFWTTSPMEIGDRKALDRDIPYYVYAFAHVSKIYRDFDSFMQ